MSESKVKEYECGGLGKANTQVRMTVSDNEVRVWVCVNGINKFRVKALGKVAVQEYQYGQQVDVIVTQEEKKSDKL